MRIVFIGSVLFSKSMLEQLIKLDLEIVGVCTKKKSKFNSDFFDLGKISLKHKIPTFYTSDINSDKTYSWIKKKRPDLIFCLGWSNLIEKRLLNLCSRGVIGFHPTDLPVNRGRHPIIWTLVLGLKKIATTFFFMKKTADSGDIISKKKILVSKNDDAQSLYNKIILNASKQIKQIIRDLKKNKINQIKQNYKAENYWRKRNVDDGKIDWRMSANNIYNLVRALSKPYLGAHFFFKNKKIILWKSLIVKFKNRNIEPGRVIFFFKSKPVVKCGENAICMLKTYPSIKIKVKNQL